MSEINKIESYAAAMEELRGIVHDLENDLVSIDDINAKIKRSAALIKYCQDRLKKTESDLIDIEKE